MSPEQFIERCHGYETLRVEEAVLESLKLRINDDHGRETDKVVAVQIGDRFTIMLLTAALTAVSIDGVRIVRPSEVLSFGPPTR